jgi:DNA-binding transcriptional ArsR family regulator
MPTQAIRSEVKFKVRRNALLLREFTIAQLVRATGLNPESVRTEVQRLRREGMVTSKRKPGQREALYRLSDDPEKRLALSRSVEAFYPEPSEPIPPRPTSRLYQAALQSLDRAEREKDERREALLAQAEHQLEGAWQAEGASRAPELVQAHILRERGRLAYLQGQREPAREQLTRARKAFAAAGLESEVRLIDDDLVYLEARRRIDVSGAVDPAAKALCVLKALEAVEHPSTGPLVCLLADLARDLSRTTEDVAVYESVAERILSEVRKKLHSERERMPMPMIIQERPSERERPVMPPALLAGTVRPRPGHGRETYFDRPRRRLRRRETDD